MDESQVRKAVLALQKFHSTKIEGKKKLIEDNPLVSIVIGLKKIPNKSFKPHRILIPHSLYPADETELCLFTRHDKKTTKELLERKGVKTVQKVIPLDKLKTDYKSYDSKKHLSCYYDVYLADRRIFHLLPKQLGKSFFIKKRFPFPVNLQKQDLSSEISTARDSTYFHLGLGSCVAVPIARINYPSTHIVENILQGMRGVINKIPRGWRNVQAVHLKTTYSISLPVYNTLPPAPERLPAMDEGGPRRKRIKLEHVSSPGNTEGEEGGHTGSDKDTVTPSLPCTLNEVSVCDEEEEEESERVASNTPPTQPTQKRKKLVSSVPGRLSRKKVRGSTVLSSRYEKKLATRRRLHGRKSL